MTNTCGDCEFWRGWMVGDTRFSIGTCERRETDVQAGHDACGEYVSASDAAKALEMVHDEHDR